MDEGEFEIARVELLSIIADIIGGKNIETNRVSIDLNLQKWNDRIDNLSDDNDYDRIVYVEMCFQYYRIKDSYYPALL